MLKLIGILCVSGAISLYGAHLSSVRRQNAKMRAELLELLARIQNGIDNGGLPLARIYADFEEETLKKRGFCEILKSGTPSAFSQALEHVSPFLPQECANAYQALAATLGKSGFRKTESATVARFIGDISALERKYAVEDNNKCVLYRKLGILCGLLAALILV